MFKYIVHYPEPDESRPVCPVTSLASLLLQDDIFKHIHTTEELFHPKHPPLHAYSVSIKDEWLGVSVFRAAQFDKKLQEWKTHPTKAIPYPMYYGWLQFFSLTRGFHCKSHFVVWSII
jgi:hypothetical protein